MKKALLAVLAIASYASVVAQEPMKVVNIKNNTKKNIKVVFFSPAPNCRYKNLGLERTCTKKPITIKPGKMAPVLYQTGHILGRGLRIKAIEDGRMYQRRFSGKLPKQINFSLENRGGFDPV